SVFSMRSRAAKGTFARGELTRKDDGPAATPTTDFQVAELHFRGLPSREALERGLQILLIHFFAFTEGQGLLKAAKRAFELLLTDVKFQASTTGIAGEFPRLA